MLHLIVALSNVSSAAPVAAPSEAPPARLVPNSPGRRPPPPRGSRGWQERDDALARAILAYREQELSLGAVTRSTNTATYVVYDPLWGPTPVVQPTGRRTTLTVLQGDHPLNALEVFTAVGDAEAHDALQRTIERKRSASHTGFFLGVGGIVAAAVGFAAMDRAIDDEQFTRWSRVTAAGLGVTTFGFIAGGIPSTRAWRLEHEVEQSITREELERKIEAHNAALAEDLGLSRSEVARIERLN